MKSLITCPECGARLKNEVTFCSLCGYDLEKGYGFETEPSVDAVGFSEKKQIVFSFTHYLSIFAFLFLGVVLLLFADSEYDTSEVKPEGVPVSDLQTIIDSLDTAIHDNKSLSAYKSLIKLYLAKGENEAAADVVINHLADIQTDLQAEYSLVDSLIQTGKIDLASGLTDTLSVYYENEPLILVMKSMIEIRSGQPMNAVGLIRQALDQDSLNVFANYQFAKFYLMINRNQQALQYLTIVKVHHPESELAKKAIDLINSINE